VKHVIGVSAIGAGVGDDHPTLERHAVLDHGQSIGMIAMTGLTMPSTERGQANSRAKQSLRALGSAAPHAGEPVLAGTARGLLERARQRPPPARTPIDWSYEAPQPDGGWI
jgi:hypothetical protein